LSNETSCTLDDIFPNFAVLHTSAIGNKINNDYVCGRPFGGTAILYNKQLSCSMSSQLHCQSTTLNTNTPRCTGIKIARVDQRDLVVVSVYMPFSSGSVDQKIQFESTIGYLQGIIDTNIGCDFVFGRDFNVSKSKSDASIAAIVQDFCCLNGILWLDLANTDTDYTYHADTNGRALQSY